MASKDRGRRSGEPGGLGSGGSVAPFPAAPRKARWEPGLAAGALAFGPAPGNGEEKSKSLFLGWIFGPRGWGE